MTIWTWISVVLLLGFATWRTTLLFRRRRYGLAIAMAFACLFLGYEMTMRWLERGDPPPPPPVAAPPAQVLPEEPDSAQPRQPQWQAMPDGSDAATGRAP